MLLLINAFIYQKASGQDIFDIKHSKQYAQYLLGQNKYRQAAEEWENILKSQNSDSNKYALLHAYRLANMFRQADTFAMKHFTAKAYMANLQFEEEYIKMLLQTGNFAKVKIILDKVTNIDTIKKAGYAFQSSILQGNWATARNMYNDNENLYAHKDNSYESLLYRSENPKHKSAALATVLSVALPGLGKVYTGNWKDGAVAFTLVGGSALQAYWGFQEKGTRSVYGWIFGGLALGYYTGNIYGSYKAAGRFNFRRQEILMEDAKRIIFSAY